MFCLCSIWVLFVFLINVIFILLFFCIRVGNVWILNLLIFCMKVFGKFLKFYCLMLFCFNFGVVVFLKVCFICFVYCCLSVWRLLFLVILLLLLLIIVKCIFKCLLSWFKFYFLFLIIMFVILCSLLVIVLSKGIGWLFLFVLLILVRYVLVKFGVGIKLWCKCLGKVLIKFIMRLCFSFGIS